MQQHKVRVHPSADRLPREEQLAWKIAEVAAGTRDLDDNVLDMIACRIVDNAGVALAAINHLFRMPPPQIGRESDPPPRVRQAD